jgi:hypothetical protein
MLLGGNHITYKKIKKKKKKKKKIKKKSRAFLPDTEF